MAERSFKEEVEKLKLGDGAEFHGEGILAVTKALLQSGVSYVAGYQGAPISHLMDVLADANDILEELGVHFENSASEATAAATLAASVNYPLRGAVTFKSTVGTNVASDALANLASGGVTGGALIIIGEDYGEGSSIMQERVHAFAMKSQMWLLDPRPNLPSIVRAVETALRAVGSLQHAGDAGAAHPRLPRLRPLHDQGEQAARRSRLTDALENPRRDLVAHRPAADDLCAREGQVGAALAGRGQVHPGQQAQRVLRRRGRPTSASWCRAGSTTRRCARWSCIGLADAFGDSQGPDLRAQRHLSAGRRRVRALLRRQEGDPDRRGRPARLHRAGGQHHPAPRRRADPGPRQGHAADGRRIHRRRGARRRRANSSSRRGPTCSRRPLPAADIVPLNATQGQGAGRRRRQGARPAAVVLHRLPGAADLRRDEAGRARTRASTT